MSEKKKTAFVGLGVMGYPMAGHLAAAGHGVAVYNRTTSKATGWLEQFETVGNGEHRADLTPKEAAEGADLVFLCVGNDDDVRSVVYGDAGVLASMAAGSILVDHTTASADLARELARTPASP